MRLETIKKICKDLLLSMFAFALPSFVLIFVIQPILATILGGEEFGLFLTKISIVRLCVGILITSLANSRLLENKNYYDKKISGDFNILMTLALVVGNIATIIVTRIYDSGSTTIDTVMTCIVLTLIMLHDYYSITYRVNMNFIKVAIDNMLITAGYVFSLLFLKEMQSWQMVFVCGYTAGLIYVLLTTRYWLEPFKITYLFRKTSTKYLQLSSSYMLSDSVNYCDKLLIYPILGGYTVSIYNAAAVVGKAIQLVSVPIQRVLLSYIVKKENIDKGLLTRIVVSSAVVFAICYGLLYVASDVLIPIMYPDFYFGAKPYVWIVLLGIIIDTMAGLLNTILLRFLKTQYQIWLSLIRLLSYVGISLVLMNRVGLIAVCIAALVAAVFRLLFVTFLLLSNVKDGKLEHCLNERCT